MLHLDETMFVGGSAQANLDYCTYYSDGGQFLPDSEFKDFWSHIELGAGNYGLDGHTKTSQAMTVLMDLKFVSDLPNYVDRLPDKDDKPYDPYHQYAVLFNTLDQLVSKQGSKGIFHVNDLFAEYAEYAADKLREYAVSKKYNDVIIEVVAGDYTKIIPYQNLIKYNKFLYDEVHLKNPEVSFFNYGMNGATMLANAESRGDARTKLQTLANLSYNGLYFFPINPQDIFIPREEKIEFIHAGVFYQVTNEYSPVPYHFPEGPVIYREYGNVYYINSSYRCS